jgi:hypothetical protein
LKTIKRTLLTVGVIVLSACAGSPTPTPTPTVTPEPTPVPTSAPSEVACDLDGLLKDLRELVPYKEMVVSHNRFNDNASLNVWFVDPALDPKASASEMEDMVEIAVRHSSEITQAFILHDLCVISSFDNVTVFAVDELYNAWYIGSVSMTRLWSINDSSEALRLEIEALFNEGYRRTEETMVNESPAASTDSCTWAEARQNLEEIFSYFGENFAFYYYMDAAGGSVWAQWVSPPEAETEDEIAGAFYPYLGQVDIYLSCLDSPIQDLWMIYADTVGEVYWIYVVDGDAVRDTDHQVMLDWMELMYP